jgi:hypothetical protein
MIARAIIPGSARVSRAGFGVSPKQSSREKSSKAGRFRQHAGRARYPDSFAMRGGKICTNSQADDN